MAPFQRGGTHSSQNVFAELVNTWPTEARRRLVEDRRANPLDREAIAARLEETMWPIPPVGAATDPRCLTCRDVGWLAPAVDEPVVDGVGLPGSPCPDCDAYQEQRRRKWAKLGPVPADYVAMTEAGYLELGGDKRALALAKRLAAGTPRNVYFNGPIGTGKTFLSVQVYDAWSRQMGGLWFAVPDLLAHIRAGFDKETRQVRPSDLIEAVSTCPLLCLDDIGAEKVTEWVEEALYRIVSRRGDERRVTLLTSNLGLVALEEHLGERIASRIEGMCNGAVLPVRGEDHRRRARGRTEAAS